jgi:hypothetical protein
MLGADETMQRIRHKREVFEEGSKYSDIVGEAVRLVQEDPNKREIPLGASMNLSPFGWTPYRFKRYSST